MKKMSKAKKGEPSIKLNIPDIEINLVDSTIFDEFHNWVFVSGILLSMATFLWGIYIPYSDNNIKTVWGLVSVFFTVLFITTTAIAFLKKRKIKKKTKRVDFNLKTNGVNILLVCALSAETISRLVGIGGERLFNIILGYACPLESDKKN